MSEQKKCVYGCGAIPPEPGPHHMSDCHAYVSPPREQGEPPVQVQRRSAIFKRALELEAEVKRLREELAFEQEQRRIANNDITAAQTVVARLNAEKENWIAAETQAHEARKVAEAALAEQVHRANNAENTLGLQRDYVKRAGDALARERQEFDTLKSLVDVAQAGYAAAVKAQKSAEAERDAARGALYAVIARVRKALGVGTAQEVGDQVETSVRMTEVAVVTGAALLGHVLSQVAVWLPTPVHVTKEQLKAAVMVTLTDDPEGGLTLRHKDETFSDYWRRNGRPL